VRLLTKSRFKLGLECPNKLFYTGKKEYANQKQDNPFLLALAEGGFQVEEYARMHCCAKAPTFVRVYFGL